MLYFSAYSKVIIIVLWLCWIFFSVVALSKNKVETSEFFIKYGQSVSADCLGVRPRIGIEFKVIYDGETSYEENIIPVLCEDDYISELFQSRVKVTFYEKEVIGLTSNDKVLLSVSEGLQRYNNSKVPFYTLIFVFFITLILALRDRKLKKN